MKTPKKHIKVVVLFFSVLMTLQSCTVYKSTPLTLEQAVQNESKIRIKTNSNKTFVYKKIVLIEGNYYGIVNNKGKKDMIPINQDLVKSIKAENSTLKAVLSLGVIAVIVGGIMIMNNNGGVYRGY